MTVRSVVVGLSLMLAATAVIAEADAGERKRWRRHAAPSDHYYAGPEFVRQVPGLRVFFGDYALSEQEFDEIYGDDQEFDETYYEPQPLKPAKPKPVAKAAKTKPAATLSTASIDGAAVTTEPVTKKPVAKKPVAASKPSSSVKPTTTAGAGASAGMSCDKASSIISGFGFAAVKPESCKGKVYAFNATRDGRNFAVKVDAASGELTEVKKLN